MTLQIVDGPIIQAGKSLSKGIDISAGNIVRITTPAGWTNANLTFQISTDGGFYNDLYDAEGREITIVVRGDNSATSCATRGRNSSISSNSAAAPPRIPWRKQRPAISPSRSTSPSARVSADRDFVPNRGGRRPVAMSLQQEWHREHAEALLLLSKGVSDSHTEWMNYCVPQLMGYGKDQDVAVAACLNMWRDTWEATHPEGAVDPGPPKPEKLARWREIVAKWNEADHPRVPAGNPDGGEFVGDNTGAEADIPDASLHPDVVDVGGDAWNKQTAKRLEREYQASKAKLEKAVTDLNEGVAPPEEDEDFVAGVPEEWDDLSEHDKEHAQELYYEYKLNAYIADETSNWKDNGGALDEAKAALQSDSVWLEEELEEWMTGKSDDIPGEGPGEPFTELNFRSRRTSWSAQPRSTTKATAKAAAS